MKKFMISCLIVATVSANNFLMVSFFQQEHARLEKDIHGLYVLLIIQSRQIETLQNLELRRINPDIQQRLKLIKDEYADVPED
tara:strand:- start:106 stop:354 length:249 start_codon:yes stop_codon:yes gene_type:complete